MDVKVVDRSSLISGLYKQLRIHPRETAIVTVDMHRGHLDMDVATLPAKPEDAKRVIANAKAVLDFSRKLKIPVIHVILVYRGLGGMGSKAKASPFWPALPAARGKPARLPP